MGRLSEKNKIRLCAAAAMLVILGILMLIPGAVRAEEDLPETPEGKWMQEDEPQDPEEPLTELENVVFTSVKRSGSEISLAWEAVPFAEGYEVEYARNAMWKPVKTMALAGDAGGVKIRVSQPALWCVRVRAVNRSGEKPVYSGDWTTSLMPGVAVAKVKYVKKGGKWLNVRKEAKKQLKKHDIGEGSCSDGKHIYMCFEYRLRDKQGNKIVQIRIAKVRLSDRKLLKVSPSLNIGHANSIIYNKRIGKLVATGGKTGDPNLRIIDPNTLRVVKVVPVNTSKFRDTPQGFNALGYDYKHDIYYVRARDYFGYMYVLNSRFVATRRFVLEHNPNTFIQGIELEGDYILLSQSRYQTSTRNTVTVFDLEGHRLQDIRLGLTGELESVFHVGNKLYGTVHVKSELSKKDRKKIKKIQKANKKRKKAKRKSVQPIYSKYRKTYLFEVTLPK